MIEFIINYWYIMCGVATALLEILYIQLFENNDHMSIFVTVLIWPVYLIGIPFRALKNAKEKDWKD